MKLKLLAVICGMLMALAPRRLRGLAFVNEQAATESNAETELLSVVNETRVRDGDWVMLSPYGDLPNAQGMQRFQRSHAEAMVNEFNSLLSLPKRMIGLPWYIGHPDFPPLALKYPDQKAYGRIKKLEAREDGLFANVKFSAEGKSLIENEAFAGHSVHWTMKKNKDGTHSPVRLVSVGFTNDPQIPVPPITRANEQAAPAPNNNFMDRTKLIAELGLAADATDEQILAAIKAAKASTTAANELQTERTARAAAEANFANERKARAGVVIAAAIAAGKITPAEKPTWEQSFVNEAFETVEGRLNALPKKINTQSQTNNLGQRSGAARSRIDQIQTFVNERMEKEKISYDQAYAKVKKENPDLFSVTT